MANDIVTFDAEINEQVLIDMLQELIDDETMLQVHTLFAKTIDPWTPFLTGTMAQSALANITPQYVHYTTPYAHYQYYGLHFNHTLTYHPLASAMWDRAAMAVKQDEFEAQVRDILIRRARQLYG